MESEDKFFLGMILMVGLAFTLIVFAIDGANKRREAATLECLKIGKSVAECKLAFN